MPHPGPSLLTSHLFLSVTRDPTNTITQGHALGDVILPSVSYQKGGGHPFLPKAQLDTAPGPSGVKGVPFTTPASPGRLGDAAQT